MVLQRFEDLGRLAMRLIYMIIISLFTTTRIMTDDGMSIVSIIIQMKIKIIRERKFVELNFAHILIFRLEVI